MPTFRVRQQEIIVLKSFDFGNNSYPLLEIVKEHDRARKDDSQKSFGDIHNELINEIKAPHVFIDLPIYIKQSGAVKDEVVSFAFRVINDIDKRCEYINYLKNSSLKARSTSGRRGRARTRRGCGNDALRKKETFREIEFRNFLI
jgi:hypothetical protein